VRDVIETRAAGVRATDVLLGLAWEEVVGALHLTRSGEVVAAWPAGHRAVWRNDEVTIYGAGDDGGDLVLKEILVPYGTPLHEVAKVVTAQIEPARAGRPPRGRRC
jgi:hypothetical protein